MCKEFSSGLTRQLYNFPSNRYTPCIIQDDSTFFCPSLPFSSLSLLYFFSFFFFLYNFLIHRMPLFMKTVTWYILAFVLQQDFSMYLTWTGTQILWPQIHDPLDSTSKMVGLQMGNTVLLFWLNCFCLTGQ